jgi:hypothetical protein
VHNLNFHCPLPFSQVQKHSFHPCIKTVFIGSSLTAAGGLLYELDVCICEYLHNMAALKREKREERERVWESEKGFLRKGFRVCMKLEGDARTV